MPTRIGTFAADRAIEARCERVGRRKVDQDVAVILIDREAGSSATALAIALPIRPSGAMRLMRIGWSAVRMRRFMAKAGAPRNAAALR